MPRFADNPALGRLSVALLATAFVLGPMHAAVAADEEGSRLVPFWSEPSRAAAPHDVPPPDRVPDLRRGADALSAGRPRVIVVGRPQPRRRSEEVRILRPLTVRVAPVQRIRLLPPPEKVAAVSIFEDRTLRAGDAVMMADGIHVFRGGGPGRFRRADFVRLPLASKLDWHLRQTLNEVDRFPPIRWSATWSLRS